MLQFDVNHMFIFIREISSKTKKKTNLKNKNAKSNKHNNKHKRHNTGRL